MYRNGRLTTIPTEKIVIKDLILVEDGDLIPADGKIIEAHDFSVNESMLTGESLSVPKDQFSESAMIIQGAMVDTAKR